MPKRFDLVVFGMAGKPVLIVECKAPEVKLTNEAFYQIARYNFTLKVKHLLITNGLQHIFGVVDYNTGQLVQSDGIFEYSQLCVEQF
jgi:hypothetical protein